MRLLPKNRDHGSAPFAWLIFLVFFYIQPIAEHAPLRSLLVTSAEVGFFLVLYFGIFWVRPPFNYALLVGMAVMGLGLGPSNTGASVFIIFTAAFIPWVFERTKTAVIALSILAVIIVIHGLIFHPANGFSVTS
ncbi:MAG TPA: hypothetical protein VN517_06035, partial [Terriglobales bacterium]|nr:hypothetical protein [Terriglobales bacterium]